MQFLSGHVVVVGGGIAGLSAALFLARDGGPGLRVTLLEASAEVGGKLRGDSVGGVPIDVGAESLLLRRAEGAGLVREVGLGGDLVAAATTSAAIWSRGRMRPVPRGTVLGVPGNLRALAETGVLTPRELARVPLDAWLPRTQIDGDVSVGRYVASRVGRAVVDRLVEPLLGGVYAGRADDLSLDATMPALAERVRGGRSLVAAAAAVPTGASGPVFGSVRGGLHRLPVAVAAAATSAGVTVRTGATVREVGQTPTGWSVTVGPTAAAEPISADAVILAVPAGAAAKLLAQAIPGLARELRGIPYASMAIATFAFRADTAAALHGSGFLVPPVDRRLIKAATFSSNKWPWYADSAPGLTLLRTSIGRYRDEEDLQRSDEELIDVARADLADATGLNATPVDALLTRWGGAIPQYLVGHPSRTERISAAAAAIPGLGLCGAAYDGIGIPACIASAGKAVAGLLEQWAHADAD